MPRSQCNSYRTRSRQEVSKKNMGSGFGFSDMHGSFATYLVNPYDRFPSTTDTRQHWLTTIPESAGFLRGRSGGSPDQPAKPA